MKRLVKFAASFAAAMIALSSCNTVQEMNVDFGSRSYTNDYSSVTQAINNLQAALEDRFNSLNDAISKGLKDLAVSVDEVTGAIKVLNKTTEEGFSKVDMTLFEGFLAVETQLKGVILAMDENGNLLSMKIDEAGNLLNATLISSIDALKKEMEASNTDLNSKLALIETALKSGFENLAGSQGMVESAIKALSEQVKNGFISQSEALEQLQEAVTSQTAELKIKIQAIQEALNNDLADVDEALRMITSSIASLKNTVLAGYISQIEALGQVQEAIEDQTTSLEAKVDLTNGVIKSGLADVRSGENYIWSAIIALTRTQDANLKAIAGKIDFDAIVDAINDISTGGADLAGVVTALNGIEAKLGSMEKGQAEGYMKIVDALEKVAFDNGLYFPKGTTDKNSPDYDPAKDPTYNMYVNPYLWKNLEQAYNNEPDKDSLITDDAKTYAAIVDRLVVYTAEIYPVQAAYNGSSFDGLHPHATFAKTGEASPIVISSEVVDEGSNRVRVIKAAGDITYSASIITNECGYPYIFQVEVYDAESQLKYDLGQTAGISVHTFQQVNSNWDYYYVNGDTAQHPFRVEWSGSNYGSVSGIKLKTYYQDATTGKTLIVDKIYLTVKAR